MTFPDFSFEKRFWRNGCRFIIGMDEAGRGAIAGPVVTGGVVFSEGMKIGNIKEKGIIINDSKKLTAKQRERADYWIKENCLYWSVRAISAKSINKIGISNSTYSGFRRIVAGIQHRLGQRVDLLLIDAFYVPYLRGFPIGSKKTGSRTSAKNKKIRQVAIVNGDAKSFSISAASIVAKVYRDRLMIKMGSSPRYKRYGWERNKGYGTNEHKLAILKYGQTGYHRKKFTETFLRNKK